MQLKLYQRMNQLLLAYIVASGAVIGIIIFNQDKLKDIYSILIFGFVIFNILCYFIYKFIEVNIDKYYIQKMAIKNHIAIANIKSAEAFMMIKDSSLKNYRLWKIQADLYDQNMNKHEIEFYEKCSVHMTSVPKGTIFMTYDESHPKRLFAIPNNVVAHCTNFAPYVVQYESNKTINIKYLNVYYNAGIMIESFKDTLKNSKKAKEA